MRLGRSGNCLEVDISILGNVELQELLWQLTKHYHQRLAVAVVVVAVAAAVVAEVVLVAVVAAVVVVVVHAASLASNP